MNLKEILKLPTPRLLAYYKKHYRNGRNPFISYYSEHPSPEDKAKADSWTACRVTIQNELSIREHVE